MDESGAPESGRRPRVFGENRAFRPLRIRDGHIRGEDIIVIVPSFLHAYHPPDPKVLTGNVPFHLLPDRAVITRVVQGARPEVPINTPVATQRSGLWVIVQQSWEEEPIRRPALSDVRDRLSAAAGIWDDDLVRSGSTDGFVSVSKNVLLSSGDFSDAGK